MQNNERTHKQHDVSLEELKDTYFHMAIKDAAKVMNSSESSLKKICRRFGISRWPYRKIHSLKKKERKYLLCPGKETLAQQVREERLSFIHSLGRLTNENIPPQSNARKNANTPKSNATKNDNAQNFNKPKSNARKLNETRTTIMEPCNFIVIKEKNYSPKSRTKEKCSYSLGDSDFTLYTPNYSPKGLVKQKKTAQTPKKQRLRPHYQPINQMHCIKILMEMKATKL